MTQPTYDPTLLPAADARVRCADHAVAIDLDPGGSALWVDELLVVDVALPWPKPVWAKDSFTAVPELVMAAGDTGRRVRVLAAVPLDDGIGRVVHHRLRDDATFDRVEHHTAPDAVAALLDLLLIEGAHPATVVSTAPVREVLVCTQGSHDVCCGIHGAALHAELDGAGWPVRRVSHTGGHRMAPTGLTLPDGRMWGGLDRDDAVGILSGALSPTTVAPQCRGWIGAEPGPAQVAERAVMAEVDDWELDAEPRSAVVVAGPDGASEVRVDAGRWGSWTVLVEPGRDVPTIACGEPGGMPAKPGVEWVVTAVDRD